MAAKFANLLKFLANRHMEPFIQQGKTTQRLDETYQLGMKLVATTMDAAPARVAAAREEFTYVKDKVMKMDVTVEEAKVGLMGLINLVGFFYLGKTMGNGRMQDL